MTRARRIVDWWARSIRWKMVGVFAVISALPMLVATEVTTQFVASTFESNVEAWLLQTSRFFVANILDEREETARVADTLVEDGSLNAILSGQSDTLPPVVSHMIDALGYDVLMIFDDRDKLVFSSRPLGDLVDVPFAKGQIVYMFTHDGEPTLMAAGKRQVTFDKRSYRVLLGTWVDQSFVSNMSAMASLSIRLFYDIGGRFQKVYSSQEGASAFVPADTLAALKTTAEDGYVAADSLGDDPSIGIYVPIRTEGRLVGAIFCGLRSDAGVAGWFTRGNIFAGIFLFGMLLSIGAGLVMSRFLTRPVTRLADGVNAIAKGDFSQRVPVRRRDELGQLAVAFNSMARQLEGLRKMEAKLRRRERMTTLGEIAAGLAHEVRNPLGIIKTSAELLGKSSNLTPVESRRLNYVVEESRRIEQLIRNFLAFAKPPQRTTDIPPRALVDRVLGICQAEIERQDVDVRIEDEAGEAQIHVDVDQMIQACLNLVLNALQAMDLADSDGVVCVATRPRLGIGISADDDEVRIVVADNGPGVPREIIDRIFDPFVTTKVSGTGLGLSRVFAVAEGHGGWVEVHNDRNGGAIFKLVIPRWDRRTGDVSYDSHR